MSRLELRLIARSLNIRLLCLSIMYLASFRVFMLFAGVQLSEAARHLRYCCLYFSHVLLQVFWYCSLDALKTSSVLMPDPGIVYLLLFLLFYSCVSRHYDVYQECHRVVRLYDYNVCLSVLDHVVCLDIYHYHYHYYYFKLGIKCQVFQKSKKCKNEL